MSMQKLISSIHSWDTAGYRVPWPKKATLSFDHAQLITIHSEIRVPWPVLTTTTQKLLKYVIFNFFVFASACKKSAQFIHSLLLSADFRVPWLKGATSNFDHLVISYISWICITLTGIYLSTFTNAHFWTKIEFSNVVKCGWACGGAVSSAAGLWQSPAGGSEAKATENFGPFYIWRA